MNRRVLFVYVREPKMPLVKEGMFFWVHDFGTVDTAWSHVLKLPGIAILLTIVNNPRVCISTYIHIGFGFEQFLLKDLKTATVSSFIN